MIPTIIRDKATKLYLLLGGFFITNAIIAEVIGVKIFSLEKAIGITPFGWVIFGHSFSFNLTAGVLLWPVVFVMTDIINGYYGIKGGSVFIFHGCCPYCSLRFVMFQWGIGLVRADFCVGNYIYKFVVAVAMTPVIYGVHFLIEKYLGAQLAAEMKKSTMK